MHGRGIFYLCIISFPMSQSAWLPQDDPDVLECTERANFLETTLSEIGLQTDGGLVSSAVLAANETEVRVLNPNSRRGVIFARSAFKECKECKDL